MRGAWLLLGLVACGPPEPPAGPEGVELDDPIGMQEDPPPVASTTAPSGPAPTSVATAAPSGEPRCCVPSGARPNLDHDPYQVCLRDGGVPWGSPGCGQDGQGQPLDPPASTPGRIPPGLDAR